MANINIANIKPPKSPNLPIAPTNYSQVYVNALTDVLRLYFNQLDIACKYLITPDIGRYLNFPFLAALDTTSQPATLANTAYAVTWDSPYLPTTYAGPNDFAPYLDIVDSSKIVIPDSHYYNFSYTLNLLKTTAGASTVKVWFRLNSLNYGDIDFPGTTRIYTLPGGGTNVTAAATIMTDEENGDSWQIMWSASTTGVTISPIAAAGPAPTGASASLAINFVSA
jgi:hypothetical protein